MVDFLPLVARAINQLGGGASTARREETYNRIRSLLVRNLRGPRKPHLTGEEVSLKRDLEQAIRWVEHEVQGGHSKPPRRRPEEVALAAIQEALNISDTVVAKVAAVPPIETIPQQKLKEAISFSETRRGPLDLHADPPAEPFDAEQATLYRRIRLQLQQIQQEVPSQERTQVDPAINDFLGEPENWGNVEFKKLLWLSGNSIRTLLTQHDAVKSDPEPHYSKLPPAVAEALRRPVQGWNILVQGDSDLAALDAQRLGPQEQAAIIRNLSAAQQLIDLATADRSITTERAAGAINATIAAASRANDDINTRLWVSFRVREIETLSCECYLRRCLLGRVAS